MKTAILIVSFGTVDKTVREKCINGIVENVKNSFNYPIYTAFTSQFIIKKIKSLTGEVILNPEQALDEMLADGITNVIILPTLLTDGEEFKKLKAVVDTYSHRLKIELILPLLSSTYGCEKMAEIMQREYNRGFDNVVLMGHGNEKTINSAYIKINNLMYDNFYVATVEGEPSLSTVIPNLSGKTVLLAPLLIAAGEHTRNDMAILWKNTLEQLGYDVTCVLRGIGEIEDIKKRFCQLIKECI